jgi:hypothetical protein
MESEAMKVSFAAWRPELLSSEARHLAEAAARQAGVPLSLWLARLVREASAAEGLPPAELSTAQAPRPSLGARPTPVPVQPEEPAEPEHTAQPAQSVQMVLTMLAENLRHGDYSPLDEARTYLRLMTEFHMSAADISAAVGRSREHFARALRLLGLPDGARALIEQRRLSPEHVYCLLDARDPAALAQAIIVEGLDVEETRRRAAGADWSR